MCVFSHICNVSVFLTFHGFVPFFSMTMPVLLFLFVVMSGSGLSDLWPPVYADHSCPFSLRFVLFSVRFSVLSILCPVYCVLYLPFLLVPIFSLTIPVLLFLFAVLSGSCLSCPYFSGCSVLAMYSALSSTLSQLYCEVLYAPIVSYFVLVDIINLFLPVLLFRPVFYPTNETFLVELVPKRSHQYHFSCTVL